MSTELTEDELVAGNLDHQIDWSEKRLGDQSKGCNLGGCLCALGRSLRFLLALWVPWMPSRKQLSFAVMFLPWNQQP